MKLVVGILLMMFTIIANAGSFYHDPVTCLALNIYHEARGESSVGQLAVGMVTLNRVKSDRYPNTICKVVWQRGQFSWTHDGKSDRPYNKTAWKQSQVIAAFLYKDYLNFIKMHPDIDFTKGALYYYAPDLANPYWANKMNITAVIGSHVFGSIP